MRSYLWGVPVQLRDALDVVALPQGVVVDVRGQGGWEEPAQPQALLLPDLVTLCQVFPVPANLIYAESIQGRK